jgi:glycerol-3-phosphate dehydrogenase
MMDDYKLGIKIANVLISQGLDVQEHSSVQTITTDGKITLTNGTVLKFDKVINVAGPWAGLLLKSSNINSSYDIDFVRGSHIVLSHKLEIGLIMEYPSDSRIFFALPYQNSMLVGTTEVRQHKMLDEVKISDYEYDYLLSGLGSYFNSDLTKSEMLETYAGVRPLIKSSSNPSKATREYALEKNGNLISVFGGKWTTSRVLGIKATELLH